MSWIVFVLFVAGVVFYFATPEERARFFCACLALLGRAGAEVVRWVTRRPGADGQPAPPVAFVTSAIVLANVCVFAGVLFGASALGDTDTLVSWGASLGPRTTNGEWWRLVTATFVHTGFLHLVAVLAGLIQVGCLTERLVGRFLFASVYLAAGAFTSVACLLIAPVTVATGASGAVLGIYGLLLGTLTWSLLRGSPVRIPWRAVKRLAPGVALFLVYAAATHRLGGTIGVAPLAGGTIVGLMLARGSRDHRPAARRVAVVTAAAAILAVLLVAPVSGMADVRPAIDRIIAMETRTSATYEVALTRFHAGTIRTLALAQLIDRTIVPELQAARAGVEVLEHVPREHQPLVALARDYLRLREQSWQLRSTGLRLLKIPTLKEAERKECDAREILRKVSDLRQHVI